MTIKKSKLDEEGKGVLEGVKEIKTGVESNRFRQQCNLRFVEKWSTVKIEEVIILRKA